MMNFEHLKQFSVVAKYLNFTRAADALFISHSTISRNMSSLEKSLGCMLFIRNNRSVKLTRSGEILLEKVNELMALLDIMRHDVQSAAQNELHKLSIASLNLYSSALFKTYGYFMQKYPYVEVSINYRSQDKVQHMLNTGDADLGITFSFHLKDSDIQNYNIVPLSVGKFQAILPAFHPLSHETSIDVEKLYNEDVILLANTANDFVKNVGGPELYNVSKKSLHMAKSIEELFFQVKSGVGFALLPQHAASEAGNTCVKLDINGVDSTYDVVACHPKTNANPAAVLFLEICALFNSK